MSSHISAGTIIGSLTFFFGKIGLLALLAIIAIECWPDAISLAILAGAICGVYLGIKWAKEEVK